jgi:hypothetical protein
LPYWIISNCENFLFYFSPYVIFSDCENYLITGFQKIAKYNNFTQFQSSSF